MAAVVDPPESPKRQKSPTEEVETSAEKTETAAAAEEESGCGSDQKNETTRNNNNNNNNKTLEKKKKNSDGDQQQQQQLSVGCVGVESGVGADETTCNEPEELTTVGKMAEEEAVVAAAADEEQRGFDWSEPEGGDDGDGGDEEEEEEEAVKTREEEQKCDQSSFINSEEKVQQVDDNVTAEVHEEPNPPMEKQEAADEEMAPVVGDVDAGVIAATTNVDAVAENDAANKAKKFRLVCKECGKGFNRRETFNLHRHFHAHEDELMPLTCKECGLTFHHRSSLIKHRNEHREEEQQQQQQQLVTPKKEVETRFGAGYECAECGRMFSTVNKLRDHNCGNAVEKPYHCPLCRQEFEYKVSVTKHMITHSQESIFTCQECNQSFPNIMALRYHQRCHTALKPYECPECGMVFKYYSVMEDHRRKHTDNTRSHLCNICGKTFKYSSLLHQHQYLHTGQKPFQCPECGKTFAFAQNMKAHCRQHRLRESNSSGSEETCKSDAMPEPVRGMGKENAHQSEESKRTFKCPLCSQTYSAPANLRAHMVFHEAEYETLDRTPKSPKENNKNWDKGFTCPHCPSVYRDESGLNVHMLSVHKSVAQHLEKVAAAPPTNQLNLLSSDNLQRKLKGVYTCTDCGKRFRHRSVLELHMRIHSKDKPYQCKVCGKGFRFSSYLQQHVIIHTGKKPYKCPDCGKDFAFLQNMRTHQKLHQEKPFRCTSCRKGYSDETQLQQHMLSHNGDKPHKCDLCDKSFGLAYLLRDHMNTHTGERPHRCDECHKTFSWFSSLLVHQKIHARKRQGYTQFNSLPISARMRGRGSRGRRGGRFTWGWSRQLVNSQPSLFPVSTLREGDLQRRTGQHQTSLISSHMDLQNRKEPWRSQPVQWKVDGGEVMPAVPSQKLHQRSSSWGDSPLKTHTGPASVHSSDSSHLKESTAPTVPKKSSPSAASETEQHRQPKTVVWSNAPTSTVLASTSSLTQDFSLPVSYSDGAALWSIRPAPQVQANSQGPSNALGQELQLPRWPGASASTQIETSTPPKKEDNKVTPSTVSQPEMPWNGCEKQKQSRASTSAQLDQSSAVPVSTPVSIGVGSTLWDVQTPPGITTTVNSPEKIVNNQDFQLQKKPVSSGWTNVQSQTTTQKVPISIQYEPHPFGQGIGTPVWGFQSNPVGPQTLLTGQLKPGNQGQELQQQQPMVTGTQIIINQSSPFFSPPLAPLPPLALPGPHPLHSVAVGALPRPPHPNIFFTPQAVMSERPHMPQTMPLPQLTPRTEPHKLGPRLPFAPERLLQCMICGCSLPRELDLQMHYLQHAQGEI